MISEIINFRYIRESPPKTDAGPVVNTVSIARSTARLDPAICKLMENRAVMVMMPARRSRTPSFTWITPVASPAIAPAAIDASIARYGFTPFTRSTAVIAAPSGKLPSTVRSGKSRILYVIYTP